MKRAWERNPSSFLTATHGGCECWIGGFGKLLKYFPLSCKNTVRITIIKRLENTGALKRKLSTVQLLCGFTIVTISVYNPLQSYLCKRTWVWVVCVWCVVLWLSRAERPYWHPALTFDLSKCIIIKIGITFTFAQTGLYTVSHVISVWIGCVIFEWAIRNNLSYTHIHIFVA